MRFKATDFYKYCTDYVSHAPPFYGIEFVQSGVEKRDVHALNTWLRRKSDKEGLSFLLDESTTENAYTERYVRTGKRGRPKRVVVGDKVGRHVHCIIGSSDSSLNVKELKTTTSEYLRKRQKKRKNLKQHKIKELTGMYIVKYQYNQADHRYSYGDYDFSYFLDERYFTADYK